MTLAVDQQCFTDEGEGVCVHSSECRMQEKQIGNGNAYTYTGSFPNWPCPLDPDDVICCRKTTNTLRNGRRLNAVGICKNVDDCDESENTLISSPECPGSQKVQLCVPNIKESIPDKPSDPSDSKEPVVLSTPKNIIDISEHNNIYDYNAAINDESVEGVIMRVGGRGWGSGDIYNDNKFDNHYENFKDSKKVKIGYYFYSQAINIAEAEEEAEFVLQKIASKRNDFPVYWDSEWAGEIEDGILYEGRHNKIDVATRTAVGLAFIKKIQSKGYPAGIYSNEYWLKDNVDLDQFINAGASIWVANYPADYTNFRPGIKEYDAWQYRSDGQVNGIEGNVDKSFVYINIANW